MWSWFIPGINYQHRGTYTLSLTKLLVFSSVVLFSLLQHQGLIQKHTYMWYLGSGHGHTQLDHQSYLPPCSRQGSTTAHAPCQLLGGELVPSLSAQKMERHSKTCQGPASIVIGAAYPSAWQRGEMGDVSERCKLLAVSGVLPLYTAEVL